MNDASISTVAHIIQLAVAPVFLLAGIGSLLNVLTGRLARVIDRARYIEGHIPDAGEQDRIVELKELDILDRRMALCHWAIGFCTSSALLVCVVVTILFVADLVTIAFAIPISLLFICAMVTLTLGLLLFLIEVTIATRSVRVNEEYVRRGRKRYKGDETDLHDPSKS